MRVGMGYDFHRLVKGRPLILGGVIIPWKKGELGHSDGDVLTHAVIDAFLGAAALGDIGIHFPPSDPLWKNARSLDLLEKIIDKVREKGFEPVNLDCVIVLEKPKISSYSQLIRENLAAVTGLPAGNISVKGKTKEKTGAVGKGNAAESYAVVLLDSISAAGNNSVS